MKNGKFRVFYYVLGVLCGYLLCLSLEKDLSVVVGKVIFAVAILITVIYWRKLESAAHASHVDSWPSIRKRSKWIFIITRYVLLRGGIFAAVFVGPAWPTLGQSIGNGGYLVMIILLMTFIMIYLGRQEWDYCQRDYEAWSLRQQAEVERDATSLTN